MGKEEREGLLPLLTLSGGTEKDASAVLLPGLKLHRGRRRNRSLCRVITSGDDSPLFTSSPLFQKIGKMGY